MTLNESTVEAAALGWFGEFGYTAVLGQQVARGEPAAERDSFGEVVLVARLREAIGRLTDPAGRGETARTDKDSLSVQIERRLRP
jgi:hypothetical protein